MTPGQLCLICDSAHAALLCRWDRWQIAKCSGCGVLFTLDRPSDHDLVQLYADGSLGGGPVDDEPQDGKEFPFWKQKEQFRILDRLKNLGFRQGRLLDVGCFTGFFLNNARQRGFEVTGVEPYREAVRYVREGLGLPVHHGNLQSAAYAPETFEVVSLLDVLEHLPDPVAELREVFRVLRPGGIVVISTPNADGLIQRVVGMKRKALRQPWCPFNNVPWHLWGFTPRTIARCVEKAGFRTESVEPLEPSPKTSNRGAGSSLWKKIALRAVAEASQLLGMSDRMVAFARKESH